MKRLITFFFYIALLLFSGCQFVVLPIIQNVSGEAIRLQYIISDDYYYSDFDHKGFKQSIDHKLENNEQFRLYFNVAKLVNYSGNGRPYSEISTYIPAFQHFSIEYLESNKIIELNDEQFFNITYSKEGTLAVVHVFTINVLPSVE